MDYTKKQPNDEDGNGTLDASCHNSGAALGDPASACDQGEDVTLYESLTTFADEDDLSTTVDSFDDMNLKEEVLRGIYSYGFEAPSLIQQRAIRPLASGKHDVIAQSQSGTGKTAAFCAGALQAISPGSRATQAVILSPTRELAKQSCTVATALARYLDVSVVACTGGASLRDQSAALRRGAQLVIGTPGRILDLLDRRQLEASDVKMLVLDEADEMLKDGDRGFRDAVYDVLQRMPSNLKLALFSATLPPEALELAARWMPDALRIVVKKEEITLAGIRNFYVYCGPSPENKLPTLCDLYESLSITQAVIFLNQRRNVEWLADALNARDFTCSAIHADMTQAERDEVIQRFRSGAARVLIATDVLARGIDIQQVNLVINFDLPSQTESGRSNYIHRVGRCGRFGRKGTALNLLSGQADIANLRSIEQYYETTIEELPSDLSILA